MYKLAAAAALGLLVVSVSVTAADDKSRFAVKGAGVTTCERYLEEYKKRGQLFYAYGGWLEGYLTAVNQFEEKTYDIIPWQNTGLLTAFLAGHCQKNKKLTFLDATRAMILALAKDRLTEGSDIVVARRGDQMVRIHKAILERVQSALSKAGHYKGTVDGVYGVGTAAAMQAYQKANGLKESGLPDQRTLLKLFSKAG